MKITSHKRAFGAVAKEYKQWRGGYDKKLFDLVFSLAPKKAEIAILDVGCGVGNSTEPLAAPAKKYGFKTRVTGVDPDGRMLVEARKSAKSLKLPIEYIEAGAEKLPFPKDSFDLAVSGAAFHWFATKKALTSIKRVLKPGGTYAAFWNLSIETGKPPIGVELYRKYKSQGIPRKLRDADNVKKIFTSAGFKKVMAVKIPFTETKTVEEIIGNLKTNSTYALLSPSDRKDFVSGMRKAYKDALKGKDTVTEKRELIVVYGVK
jgi:ubiquinone/menaquinone biosynthesis C-methylase UbiE